MTAISQWECEAMAKVIDEVNKTHVALVAAAARAGIAAVVVHTPAFFVAAGLLCAPGFSPGLLLALG